MHGILAPGILSRVAISIDDLINMFIVPENKIRELLDENYLHRPWQKVLESVFPRNPLNVEGVASLLHGFKTDPEAFDMIISKAREIKKGVFGNRVKLFIPVYISNSCVNECRYCAYRSPNVEMPRRTLTEDEFRGEIETVMGMGYRVIELVTSESEALLRPGVLPRYIRIAREVINNVKTNGDAPELILMSWALSDDEHREVCDAGVDSFYLWQETYDNEKYKAFHPEATPKADFDWRVGVFDRAIRSGIKKVGLGVLFGLAPWEFDVLALISHGRYIESAYNLSPDAFGLPRFKHADGAELVEAPYRVTDEQLRMAVALYRLAFPQSHVFLNTREKLSLLYKLLEGGGSEMNIACSVYPGGYSNPTMERQFDFYNYPTEKTLQGLMDKGYEPTHCGFPQVQKLHQ